MDVPTGEVTVGDLLNVQPFGNTLDLVEIEGRYIREALEHSVSGLDPDVQDGKFLQMTG